MDAGSRTGVRWLEAACAGCLGRCSRGGVVKHEIPGGCGCTEGGRDGMPLFQFVQQF